METTAEKACFAFFVDDKEYTVDRPKLTGEEIMKIAGVSPQEGLILIQEDGSQEIVHPETIVKLAPCARLERAPRFKRGER